MTDAVTLTTQRKSVHGDWKTQAAMANKLKAHMREYHGWAQLDASRQEALDMIATKISRIVCGDPDHEDHWDDIGGYAHLGKGGHV